MPSSVIRPPPSSSASMATNNKNKLNSSNKRRPWRPLTANCCSIEDRTVFRSFSRCRPTRSEFSKDIVELPSFRRLSFSDLSSSTASSARVNEELAHPFGADLHVFQLSELRAITQNFSSNYLLGEGGFGTVHKGYIDENFRQGLKAQPVAVKLLDIEGLQGHREWLAEVMFLGQLRHSHLVKLIGYCCEDEERLLVYEFMPRGSLENHLFRRFSASLAWGTRLKIAIGAAKGLAFLHGAEKPVIYRDFKTSNVLLDSDFTAKLSDFGLAKMGPEGSNTHVTTRVMGTYGYAAPEYVSTGHLTTKSDVYSFGVVLLELLTGRRSMDKTKPKSEQNLVDWARPYLSSSRKLRCIMDPKLAGQYSVKGAREMAALALQCVSPHPKDRPRMPAIVEKLEGLQSLRDMAVSCGQWPATPKSSKNGVSSSSLSVFSSSLAIFFCLFLSWVSSSASPSPAPAPAFAASEYLRSRGYSLFAAAMDASLADAGNLVGGWNGTGTIFAPPDFAFSSATARFKNRGASSPLKQSSSLLHYHTLRQILRYQDLKDRPDGEAFATFSSQRCIFKSKNPAGDLSLSQKKKPAGAYVTIRRPDLYIDENIIVHGVDGALDPFSASRCAIDEADLEADTATARASSPVAAIDFSYLDHAVRALRRRGFSVVATAMTMRRSDLMSLTAVTVFAPRDGSLFAVDDGFRYDFRHHVVQQRLPLRDLARLPDGTEIETMAPGETVIVRPINGDVTVNGARVDSSEIYQNDWIVILEISNPLHKSDKVTVVPAGSPVTSKDFSVIFDGLSDPGDSRSYLSPSPEKELDNSDLDSGKVTLAPATVNSLIDGRAKAPDSGDIVVTNTAPMRSSDVSVRPPSPSPASMASFSIENVPRSPDVRSRKDDQPAKPPAVKGKGAYCPVDSKILNDDDYVA